MTLTDRKLQLIELLLRQHDETLIQSLEQLLITPSPSQKASFDSQKMQGSVVSYEQPFEPVTTTDWEAL